MKEYAIALDIGGTNSRVSAVTREGEVLTNASVKTASYFEPELFTRDLELEIDKIISSIDGFKGIGIGAPCVNINTESIENASNLNWKTPLSLCRIFRNRYHVPCFITNDANLFALGESFYGTYSGLQNFMVITLGTGVGAGIFTGGQLLIGRDGLAGEVGHVIIDKDGRDCQCGRKGCLETYTSATGIVRTAFELMSFQKGIESELSMIPSEHLTSKDIGLAAKRGDQIALKTLENAGRKLGDALVNLATLFNPEMILIGGGASKAGDFLLGPCKRQFEDNLINIYPQAIPIEETTIAENDAAVLGAGALLWRELGNLDTKVKSVIS
ncbi:MAG: ROK family protein [Cyclobacteriaceae bacterium]